MSVRRARRTQAQNEVHRLLGELEEWYNSWTDSHRISIDLPRDQYRSQLDAVRAEVKGAGEILLDALATLDMTRATGLIYSECGRIERQTIWLWKVWYYFRDKFDQRLDPRFRDTLRAADEVIWSCYRPYFKMRGPAAPHSPPPLPYIEADYSPAALRRHERNALQRKGRDFDLVSKAFEKLPVPLLKIPITTVLNPWSLVLIGHEAGHYIQPAIAPGFAYVRTFGESIAQAVEEASGSVEGDADAWHLWGDEIFADWYSILTMGTWSLWSMAQFEIAEAEWMMTRRTVYPSPLVRLALMAAVADSHGLDGTKMLDKLGLNPKKMANGHEEATRDLEFIASVVPAIIKELPEGQGALPKLVGFDAADYSRGGANGFGEVEQWSRYLIRQGGAKPGGNKQLQSARMVAAGTAASWSKHIFGEEPPEEGAAAVLKNFSIKAIIAAAEPGKRSSGPALRIADPGVALAALLKHADDDLVAPRL